MAELTFSVIIPTYGREAQLHSCLRALARLDYPPDRFEVIVVDDGSDPPASLPALHVRGPIRLSLLRVAHAGPAAARNAAAALAKGRFLVFIDDDCACAPDWLRGLEARFTAAPDHAIGGQTLNAFADNLYSTASQLHHAYMTSYHNAGPGAARFLGSANFAVPAADFRAIGGFNTIFGTVPCEDREFCFRWRHRGYQLTYAHEVVVTHARPLTFQSFWRQHVGYGRGAFYFHTLRAQASGERFRPEPAFYLILLRYPFAKWRGRRAWALSVLLAVTQAASAAGFLWAKLRGARMSLDGAADPRTSRAAGAS